MKKNLIFVIFGIVIGAVVMRNSMQKKVIQVNNMSDKHLALFLMMNQWTKVKQRGKKLAAFFEKNGYQKIAVYGMSYAGETLLTELRESEIQVIYGIDRDLNRVHSDIDMFTMEDSLQKVDAIVVTAITFFEEIAKDLSSKVDCPIISLEDILYEV